MLRTCVKCGTEKPLEEFYKHQTSALGRSWTCKACESIQNREYRIEHADRLSARQKEIQNQRAAEDENYHIRRNLRNFYRLTLQDYAHMLAVQGGVCAVCGTAPEGRRLHVDHDRTCCPGNRSCGKCVRGLLCNGCNNGTGLKDDPVLLLRRADYVEHWRALHHGMLFEWPAAA